MCSDGGTGTGTCSGSGAGISTGGVDGEGLYAMPWRVSRSSVNIDKQCNNAN